ncbi:MAG: FAD-linked oxidase C-terminal domain-containing protein [Pseudomonadota bacterium]
MRDVALTRQETPSSDMAISQLQETFGDRIKTGATFREQHCHTTSFLPTQPPDAVFSPQSVEEIRTAVSICAAKRFPIIPFGAGTSLEGQLNAPRGGLSLDMGNMNAIMAVNADDLDCIVQPGLTRHQLNDYVRSYGLFFPIDPGADASLGGMASTRASGTNAVRYGTMKQNVLSMKVVLPNGDLIQTAGRARKSAAGYELTNLFVGAEGTLGIIAELTLRLYGLPEKIVSGTCAFPSLDKAVRTVIETIQMGVPVARIELMDPLSLRAVNAYSGLDLPEAPTLFVEFHGMPASVDEQVSVFGDLCAANGSAPFQSGSRLEDRNRLWAARHDLYFAFSELRRNAKGIPTDACVPISRLADCIQETEEDIDDLGLLAPIVGHVGDGNFHLMILVDPEDDEEMERSYRAVDRLNERAIRMGGTCTGEHGIGQGKRRYMETEFGAAAELMRDLKKTIDPHAIMNPDKIL